MKQKLDSRRVWIFILFAFGIAWAVGLWIYLNGGLLNSPVLLPGTSLTLALVVIAFGYMWAPALANILTRLVTKEGWKDVGLRGRLRAGWPAWVAAWLLPAILTFLGIGIYFALFPLHFDPSLGALQQMLDMVEQQTGEAIPLSPQLLLAIQLVQGILLAPVLNGFFTFGEEFGWRAYLQPKLMALGFRKAMLLTGVIWGLWHAPIIAMGHNYGFGYPGAPWSGILAMTFFTITVGIVFGWLTLRAGSVWPAVIAHASLNGIAPAAILFLHPDANANPLLGPLAVGVIGGIPWLLLAAYLFWKGAPIAANVSRETSKIKTRKPKARTTKKK